MNCILPRALTLRQLTDKQKKLITQAQDGDRLNGFEEIFIPELCIKYEFPGLLWYKAMMLPTILHRLVTFYNNILCNLLFIVISTGGQHTQ